jgi:hypothetical protein
LSVNLLIMKKAKFKELISRLEETKSELVFPNDGPDHAEILMSKIFDSTKNEISILSGALGSPLTSRPNYLKSLRNLLERNVRIRVVLVSKNDSNEESEALKLLKSKGIPIKVLNEEEKKAYLKMFGGLEKHFCFSDEIKFRFEYNPKEYKAFASFNNREMVSDLSKIFDVIYNKVAA